VGYDAKKTMGEKQSGAVVALPIWIETMQSILKDKPIEQFQTAVPAEPPPDPLQLPPSN
jgi:membrane carboxypeptidase/penicillin-binding protein